MHGHIRVALQIKANALRRSQSVLGYEGIDWLLNRGSILQDLVDIRIVRKLIHG